MKKLRYVHRALCILCLALCPASALVCTGCVRTSGSGRVPDGTYTWIAGGEGGGWYTIATEFARFLGEKESRITINVVPGGGFENPVLLDQGDVEIAWGVGYVNWAAYNGIAPLFHERHTNMASIAGTLSVDYYHFLAGEDQGIATVGELAAKIKNGESIRLAVPETGTSDYVMSSIILDFYDVSFDMIKRNGGNVIQTFYGDIVNMFTEHRVDYAVVNLGLPGAVVTEMAGGRPSVLLAVSNETIDYCHFTWGTVARATGLAHIPSGTYPGINIDIPAVGHSTEIIVSPKLPESVAYTFTKVLNENKDFLVRLGANYADFDPSGSAATSVQVPLHPGAARYYREAGVLETTTPP